MRYLMIVATDPDHSAEDVARAPSIEAWVDQVTASGAWVMGERLRPTTDATTVRVRGGELLITDGPFVESKEWIAGIRHPRMPGSRCRDRDCSEPPNGVHRTPRAPSVLAPRRGLKGESCGT